MTVKKHQTGIQRLLTGQDVLVAILSLVLWPLALLPGVEELALLLLQHLWGRVRENNLFWAAKGSERQRKGSFDELLGFLTLRRAEGVLAGREREPRSSLMRELMGGEGTNPCREQKAHSSRMRKEKLPQT